MSKTYSNSCSWIIYQSWYYIVMLPQILAMLNIADKKTFGILSKTWVVLRLTSDATLISVSFGPPTKHIHDDIILLHLLSFVLLLQFPP